jgi:hypothetical protein
MTPSAHLADDDALVSGSSNPHVTDALENSIPLFSDDGDTLHDPPVTITIPSSRSRPIPKWNISTLVGAATFLVGLSACYQKESPPPPFLLRLLTLFRTNLMHLNF